MLLVAWNSIKTRNSSKTVLSLKLNVIDCCCKAQNVNDTRALVSGSVYLLAGSLQCAFECMYLYDRRLRCRLTGCSRRRNHWLSLHSDPGSGRAYRSCCSGPGIQVGPLGWSSPSPPGPEWRHSAADSGCSPESLSVWKQCLLPTKKQILYTWYTSTSFLVHRSYPRFYWHQEPQSAL